MSDKTNPARWRPGLMLFILSPCIAELLTSAQPPTEFFHPFRFVVNLALYGSGAVLVREFALRRRKGWPTMLALGLVFGIFEEGLMIKSFFNPGHGDLDTLSAYGRWAGVNWVWSLNVTIAHAGISIMLPIGLATAAFAERRSESWVGRPGIVFLCALFLLTGFLGFLYWPPYRPPVGPYLGACFLAAVLFVVAMKLPRRVSPWSRAKRGGHPLWLFLAGFLSIPVFWATPILLQQRGAHPLATMAASVGIAACIALVIAWLADRHEARSLRSVFLPAAGALTWLILLTPLWEAVSPKRGDNTRGMAVVGLVALAFLVWLTCRVRQRIRREQIS